MLEKLLPLQANIHKRSAMEMLNNKLRQYFDDILANISEQEFDLLLKQVEPYSHIGMEVMRYYQYTQSWINDQLLNNEKSYTFENQTNWCDNDSHVSCAA